MGKVWRKEGEASRCCRDKSGHEEATSETSRSGPNLSLRKALRGGGRHLRHVQLVEVAIDFWDLLVERVGPLGIVEVPLAHHVAVGQLPARSGGEVVNALEQAVERALEHRPISGKASRARRGKRSGLAVAPRS